MEEQIELIIEENKLSVILNESGLEKSKSQILLEKFQDYFKIASEWERKTKELVINDISQIAEMKMCREAYKVMKDKVVDVEKTRKELKESSLREGQTIDSIAKILKNLIEPIRDELKAKSEYKERKEAELKEQIKQDRLTKLTPFNIAIDSNLIGNMTEEMFNSYFNGVEKDFKDKQEAERKAELERIKEQELIKLYNERKEILIPFWNFLNENSNELDFSALSENEFNLILEKAKQKKIDNDKEQEKIRIANERLQKEAKEREKLIEQRNKELAPFIIFIRDYNKMLNFDEPNYQSELLHIKRAAKEHYEFEAKETERKIKEKEIADKKLADAEEARLKAEKLVQEANDAEAKRIRDAEEEAEKEAAMGDKEKFDSFISELEVLKSKYIFKSKKYKILFASAVDLLNKTINFLISKN